MQRISHTETAKIPCVLWWQFLTVSQMPEIHMRSS